MNRTSPGSTYKPAEPRLLIPFAVREIWSLPLQISLGCAPAASTSKGANMKDETNDLDLIFCLLEAKAAKDGKSGSGALEVIESIAENDGLMLVTELLQEGHTKSAIALALQPPSDDGRAKPRAKAGVIDGERLIWLSSSGWASVGQSNRREAPPTSSRVQHRLSIPRFSSWIEYKVASQTRDSEIFWDVAIGSKAREMIERHKQVAWSLNRLQTNAELLVANSQLLGGVYPDLIVVSNLPDVINLPDGRILSRAEFRETFHPAASGLQDFGAKNSPETISAIEIELSAKSTPALDGKVRQHDAALAALWWHEVIWVVDDPDVVTRLKRSGVGSRPGHCFVDAGDVGISTAEHAVVSQWWPASTFTVRQKS